MSKIRIFSKKAFALGPGAIRDTDIIEAFVTVPGTFQSIDERLTSDPTFKLAVKAREIEIVNACSQKSLENTEVISTGDDDKSGMSALEEYYNTLKVMNKEDTIKEANKLEVKLAGNEKLGTIKKMVFEAYKLVNEDDGEPEGDPSEDHDSSEE